MAQASSRSFLRTYTQHPKMSTQDNAGSGSSRSTKRKHREDRSAEYDKDRAMKSIRSRPESQEADVLKELTKCKNKLMVDGHVVKKAWRNQNS